VSTLLCVAFGFATLLVVSPSFASAADVADDSGRQDSTVQGEDDVDDGIDDGESFDPEPLFGEAVPGDTEPVADFDEGMSAEEKNARMTACVGMLFSLAHNKKETIQKTMKELIAQKKMPEDEALKTLLYTWGMTCYLNSDSDIVSKAQGKYTPEMDSFFAPKPDRKQQVTSASEAQVELLGNVFRKMSPQDGGKTGPKTVEKTSEQTSAGSSSTKFMYSLLLLGMVFGVAALGVLRLMRKTQLSPKQTGKSSKSALKAQKAEKKLEKKQF
jgi:hypothetical protein